MQRFLPSALVLGVAIAGSVHAAETSRTIDFQSPSLGGEPRRIVNPYVAKGVTFTAIAPIDSPYSDEVVGLVKNSETSACAGAPDTTQRLGTGRVALTN